MNNIGRIVSEDVDNYFIENAKNYEIDAFPKTPDTLFEVDDYVMYSIEKNTLHKTYKYNSLPATNIITETDVIDELIAFESPFHIVGCLSQKEAELGFNEFFQKSSCNFVKNLKYIENDEDGHYDVRGDIGLYYNERFSGEDFVEKFNAKFDSDVENVLHNLEKELAIIENEKEVIKVSNNLFLFSVVIVIIVMALGIFFKH